MRFLISSTFGWILVSANLLLGVVTQSLLSLAIAGGLSVLLLNTPSEPDL